MNAISIAEQLLKAKAESTTDATAFKVNVIKGKKGRKERIALTADTDRRGDRDGTFYHMDVVVDICRTLHLSSYITTRIVFHGESRIPSSTFDVEIY